MGASIECRVPFLDYRLVQGLASISSSQLFRGKQTKSLLRRALGHRLPESVLRHHKWGFAVPWHLYMRHVPVLRELVHDIPNLEPIRHGPFNRRLLRAAIELFLAGDNGQNELVRQLMLIVVWYQTCFATSVRRLGQVA
jgi:asparagine synthase (glutamine-hydrolysing)